MMKKLFTLSLLFAVLFKLSAQENHLIIFSEDLQPFSIIVNGVKQNNEPQTNVKVIDLNEQSYQIMVQFKDETLPSITKNVYFEPMGMAYTLKIKMTKKGYKLRVFGQVPLAQSPQNYTEIAFHAAEYEEEEEVQTETEEVEMSMGSSITLNSDVHVTETKPSGSSETTSENVNIGINIGGISMGVDVNISETTTQSMDMDMDMEMSQTIQVEEYEAVESISMGVQETVVEEEPCNMSPSDFNSAKDAVAAKTFSDTMLSMAKQITKTNCLDAEQVKEITKLFDFESNRLEYAKFAYEYCNDRGNYFKVNDAFEFSFTSEELDEYISNY